MRLEEELVLLFYAETHRKLALENRQRLISFFWNWSIQYIKSRIFS